MLMLLENHKKILEDMCFQIVISTTFNKIKYKLNSFYFLTLGKDHKKVSNHICLKFLQVLGLDSNIKTEVAKLKRDLMKLINVREFSKEAQFVDPCLSHILTEVRI